MRRWASFAAALAVCGITSPAPGQVAAPGRTAVYRIAYQSAAASDLAPLLAGTDSESTNSPRRERGFTVSIAGDLRVTPLEQEGSQTTVAYAIRDPEVRFLADGVSQTAAAERVSAGLARGVFATLDATGRVVAAQIDPQDGALAHSTWRTLLGLTQFAVPAADPEPRWTVAEDDPGGDYRASYEIIAEAHGAGDGQRLEISKARLGYTPEATGYGPARPRAQTTIHPGSWIGHYDRVARRLVSLGGSETQQVELAGRSIAETVTTLELTLLGEEAPTPAAVTALRAARTALARAGGAVPLSWREPANVRRAALHRQALGDATLASLLGDLAAAEHAGDGPPGSAQLFRRFTALIALQPKTSGNLAAVAAGAASTSLTFHTLAGALGAAGHEEAQTALAELLTGRAQDLEALSVLLPALSETAAPSPAAEAALRKLAFDRDGGESGSLARLSLGTMARGLSLTGPARAEAIVDDLIAYASEHVEGDREILAALGNAGSPRALPRIRGHLADSDAGLRRAAVRALRLIPGGEVDTLLIAALAGDTEPAVRLEAARALEHRQPTTATIDAQRAALAREADDKVRSALQENLTLAGASPLAGE